MMINFVTKFFDLFFVKDYEIYIFSILWFFINEHYIYAINFEKNKYEQKT